MRVALTVEPCWQPAPGGTATAAAGLAGALDECSEVSVIGVAARHRGDPLVHVPVPVVHLPLPRVAMYEAWHRLRRPRVERATGPVDVVHATGGAMAASRAPLVATIHDLAWAHEPAHFTRRGVRFHRRSLRLALRHASLMICPSQATADDLTAAGANPDRVRVIPWGIHQRRGDATRARHDFALPERFLLFAGTVEPRKNLKRLLQALDRLGQDAPPLVLVGPQGWDEDLGDRLAALPVPARSLGFVPENRLPDLYAAATAVCYPSLSEGFGLPVLEAMAQGTPVVTSAGTATEEIAGGAAALVDPNDVNDMAGVLGELLADEGEMARLGRLGLARATQFTWERCATAHVAAYRDALR